MRAKPLQNAFLISIAVHLGVLLAAPGPDARTIEPQPLTLQVALTAPAPPEDAPAAPETPLAPPETPLKAMLPAPPEPETEPAPSPEAPEPEPEPEPAPVVPEPAVASAPAATAQPTMATAPADATEPNDNSATDGALDAAALQRCLEDTAKIVAEEKRQGTVRKYRFYVREQIRNALDDNYPEIAVKAEDGVGEQRAILSFRVEREGYLYYMSLRAAPGSRVPGARLQRIIEELSPFAPPPANAALPLSFRFELIMR
ncbi:MAG: hypothetical protein AAF581_13320 [Planctomycetota bacterium]